jgi:antitoxin component YwqK of YwqJK toxin-antitoxin module
MDTRTNTTSTDTEPIPFVLFFDHGGVAETGWTKNGERHGQFTQYFDNGFPESKPCWKEGKLDGLCEEYYDTGTIKHRINFKDDEVDGIKIDYYPNGSVKEITYNDQGTIIDFMRFFENGWFKERSHKKGNDCSATEYKENGENWFRCQEL